MLTSSIRTTAGANVTSDSAVVALKVDETRSLTFTHEFAKWVVITIGVVVIRTATDPSDQATPPMIPSKKRGGGGPQKKSLFPFFLWL